MKICLGTAQSIQGYGILNSAIAPNYNALLNYCKRADVTWIDTAIAYENEHVLNKHIQNNEFQIITKFSLTNNNTREIYQEIKSHLSKLGVKKIYGLLLHNTEKFDNNLSSSLIELICKLKSKNRIEKFGLSVYEPETLLKFIDKLEIDLVQLPLNIMDRRFYDSLCIDLLLKKHIEIHIRSVFLQGLLITKKHLLPPWTKNFDFELDQLNSWLNKTGCSAIDACLGAVSNIGAHKIVIGASNLSEFHEVLTRFQRSPSPFPIIKIKNKNICMPNRWQDIQN